MDNPTAFPLAVQAAAVQFAPAHRLSFDRVESRMWLSCLHGRGRVEINGSSYELTPAVTLILPWAHAITYVADRRDPFMVCGLHLVPWHDADARVVLDVPHSSMHPLAGVRSRHDDPTLPGSQLVLLTNEGERPTLAALFRYAVLLWELGPPPVEVAKALGALAIAELRQEPRYLPQDDPDLPKELRQMLRWIESNLRGHITVRTLAEVADRAPTSVNRLFRTHLGVSPIGWVIARRIERASQLLSTTHLSVTQIAHQVGLADQYYFSRLFKDRTGSAPTEWRQRRTAP